jgi:hypothetical protein
MLARSVTNPLGALTDASPPIFALLAADWLSKNIHAVLELEEIEAAHSLLVVHHELDPCLGCCLAGAGRPDRGDIRAGDDGRDPIPVGLSPRVDAVDTTPTWTAPSVPR